MSTPAGLTRFSRTINSKRPGKCHFCDTPTQAFHGDYASVDASGRWIAVCGTCAVSITAQVKALVMRLENGVAAMPADVAHRLPEVAAMLPERDLIANAVNGTALDTAAYDVLVKLQAALVVLSDLSKPQADSNLLARLWDVANNAQAQPRDRDFARSLASQLASKGALTVNQMPHAERLIARYADGAPVAAGEGAGVGLYLHDDGTIRRVYVTKNDRLGCRILIVHTHGDESHGAFEYEQGGRRIVSDALAAGTCHLMTTDEAASFGRLHSFCCNCARDLQDDRSLAAGYGPDCAENNGWWYPTYEQAAAILQRPVTKPSGKVVG